MKFLKKWKSVKQTMLSNKNTIDEVERNKLF